MKILKPGKVEQRKFTCPRCGCVFLAMPDDFLCCPQEGCDCVPNWDNGEPYEEPAIDRQSVTKRLADLIRKGMCKAGTHSGLAEFLVANGVTFKEEPVKLVTEILGAPQRETGKEE